MSKVTQAMKNHHHELAKQLEQLVNAIYQEQPGANPEALVSFLKQDLLPHAAGEEKELYPVVGELVRQYGKPTATMSIDHEYIGNYIKSIEETSKALERATPEERPALQARLARLGLQLEALFHVHLDKEERVYLPLFEKYVSEQEQQKVLDGMHEAHGDENEAASPVKATVDVRIIPPSRRHPLIFETFESLQPGEAFELINDHDPKPLYYQFQAERGGEFTWDYLQAGPEVWQVQIGKK